jgi:hypothetical protein
VVQWCGGAVVRWCGGACVGQFYEARIINAYTVEYAYVVEVLDETLDVGAQGRMPLPALFLLSTPHNQRRSSIRCREAGSRELCRTDYQEFLARDALEQLIVHDRKLPRQVVRLDLRPAETVSGEPATQGASVRTLSRFRA